MRTSRAIASRFGARRLLYAGVALIVIGGCPVPSFAQDDSGASIGQAPETDAALESEVTRALSDAATTAQHSMDDMLAASGSNGLSQGLQPINVQSMPPELQRPLTIAWTGAADQIVQKIAEGIGYTFLETGPIPSVPDMVVVRYSNEPTAVVLQDIGLRINKTAQVSVDTTARSITFENTQPLAVPVSAMAPTTHKPQNSQTNAGGILPKKHHAPQNLLAQ